MCSTIFEVKNVSKKKYCCPKCQGSDPEQKEISRQNALKGWSAPNHKEMVVAKRKETYLKHPEIQINASKKHRETMALPENKEALRERALEQFKDPNQRMLLSERMKKIYNEHPGKLAERGKKHHDFYSNHPEIKIKQGEKMKNKYRDGILVVKGENNPFYGKKHAKESLEKMSAAGKEIWNTPEKKEFARQRRLKQAFPFKDTKIEIKVQEALKEKGVEFKIHVPILGQPDIFIEPNICIFCDGDYWHANPERYKANDIMKKGYTAKQIQDKDCFVTQTLKSEGYLVLRFWEHDINENFDSVIQEIISIIPKNLGLLVC